MRSANILANKLAKKNIYVVILKVVINKFLSFIVKKEKKEYFS